MFLCYVMLSVNNTRRMKYLYATWKSPIMEGLRRGDGVILIAPGVVVRK